MSGGRAPVRSDAYDGVGTPLSFSLSLPMSFTFGEPSPVEIQAASGGWGARIAVQVLRVPVRQVTGETGTLTLRFGAPLREGQRARREDLASRTERFVAWDGTGPGPASEDVWRAYVASPAGRLALEGLRWMAELREAEEQQNKALKAAIGFGGQRLGSIQGLSATMAEALKEDETVRQHVRALVSSHPWRLKPSAAEQVSPDGGMGGHDVGVLGEETPDAGREEPSSQAFGVKRVVR